MMRTTETVRADGDSLSARGRRLSRQGAGGDIRGTRRPTGCVANDDSSEVERLAVCWRCGCCFDVQVSSVSTDTSVVGLSNRRSRAGRAVHGCTSGPERGPGMRRPLRACH